MSPSPSLRRTTLTALISLFILSITLSLFSVASPLPTATLGRPTDYSNASSPADLQFQHQSQLRPRNSPDDPPSFPGNIPSCVACQPQWGSIDSCAKAAPALQNASQIIWNPLLFVSLIKCACTDTFMSAYPQCVDCFVQTNQCETYLGGPPSSGNSIIGGLRSVCGFGSAILGGVASSQASAGISYTYTGQPSQANAAHTTGPGGADYGSEMGAKSGATAVRSEVGYSSFWSLITSVAVTLVVGIASGTHW